MVLHLLGKKSWNVYNRDNVDRVRRDEAAAAAREEETERRMQDEDAARRIAILRGEVPPPIPSPSPPPANDRAEPRRRDADHGRDRKRRRLRGEDDTDRDLRIAREDAAVGAAARENFNRADKKAHESDVWITDHAGHIQLFAAPNERTLLADSRNAEAEADKAKKAREYEDQYTMRFSNAAGFRQSASSAPWYAASDGRDLNVQESPKDVWGNEDPGRKAREQTRVTATDPMAFMKRAQTQLKQSESDREKWKVQRERELRELKRAEREDRRIRRKQRHVSRHRHDNRERSIDSLEGFSLDAPAAQDRRKGEQERRSQRDLHEKGRRSRSRSRDHRHNTSYHPSHRSHRHRSTSPRR